MDPIDSGQEPENPSEKQWDLTPSSKGRQRKKNPKYADYETDATSRKITCKKSPKKSSRGRQTASNTTPTKTENAENSTQQAADGEEEGNDKIPEDGKTSEVLTESCSSAKKSARARKTPVKRTPAKKTPVKKTPVKKTPVKKTPVKKTPVKKTPAKKTPAKEAADTVEQENGTPKPKRKSVRNQPLQKEAPDPEAPCEEAPAEPEEEVEPGGRRRRGAAKAALKYLQILAKEVFSHSSDDSESKLGANSRDVKDADTQGKDPKGGKVSKGKKRKRRCSESDAADDEDFVPVAEEEEAEDMEEDDAEEEEGELEDDLDFKTRGPPNYSTNCSTTIFGGKSTNGLSANSMKIVHSATETTKTFREQHHSSWVFPAWLPSTGSWHPVPQSDLDKYLPQELRSAAFKVSREGLSTEEEPLQRLDRFSAESTHPERWDMMLFTGGPVWAMEWCPTPDGAPATQYIALACHQGMDDQHCFNRTYTGSGLIQLWDMGKLEYNSRPESQPVLAYGLAQDKGFIWNMKWCPAGGWELPSCDRAAPFMPRLGLLAVATSTGVVTIYSLPHPEALLSNKSLPDSETDGQQLPIYQATGLLTLKLGSFKAPHNEKSGQVLSMDWLPKKPHNIIAIGFYDGIVGLWDLNTKSALLRVRESDRSLSLLPYRCLVAHDHAVRALAFCPASSHLLVTAGEDRYVKTWDLRRSYDPVTVQKRYLTNEISWPMNAPGLLITNDVAYVAKGTQGLHYVDHYMRSIFAIARTGSVWSVSYSDWLNSVVTSDVFGEVILALLPQISVSPSYLKRTIDRRYPVYFTSMVPHETTEENKEVEGAEEEKEEEGGEERERGEEGEGNAPEEQEGRETEERDAGSEGRDENRNENGNGNERRGRIKENPPLQFQTYKEAVKKYYLHYSDNDLRTFARSEKRPMWKRMRETEMKAKMNLDEMPLPALHKVRFNPNMSSHIWMVSGGQSGLVRLNCLRSVISSKAKSDISKSQAAFDTLSPSKHQTEADTETDSEVQ